MSWWPTKYEDLHRIVLSGDGSDADTRPMLPDTGAARDLLKENARTWEEGGRIVAIAGVAPLWKGVGTVWTVLSEESRQRGVRLTRGVLQFIDMLHEERGYWRLQATIEHGDDVARHWILQLGFQYEGTMNAYGPDLKTHDMYARVRI
jgi:hypothetical protein